MQWMLQEAFQKGNAEIAEDSQRKTEESPFPLRLFPHRTLRSNVRLIFVLNFDARTHHV